MRKSCTTLTYCTYFRFISKICTKSIKKCTSMIKTEWICVWYQNPWIWTSLNMNIIFIFWKLNKIWVHLYFNGMRFENRKISSQTERLKSSTNLFLCLHVLIKSQFSNSGYSVNISSMYLINKNEFWYQVAVKIPFSKANEVIKTFPVAFLLKKTEQLTNSENTIQWNCCHIVRSLDFWF